MKTLLTILASVGLSMIIMYFLIRKHNIDYHKKNCPCKKRGVATPVFSPIIDSVLNPIVDPIIAAQQEPEVLTVDDVLKKYNIIVT